MLMLGIVLTARAAKCSTEESETDEDKPDPPGKVYKIILQRLSAIGVNRVIDRTVTICPLYCPARKTAYLCMFQQSNP